MTDAEEASKLLNHPFISKFFAEAKNNYHRIIENTGYEQDGLRTDCYLMLRALNELEEVLKDYIRLGEVKEPKKIIGLKPIN